MRELDDGKLLALCTAGLVAVVALLFYLAARDKREWERFAVEHRCRVIATETATVVPVNGIASNGKVTFSMAYVPGKTTYLCDDGVRYTR